MSDHESARCTTLYPMRWPAGAGCEPRHPPLVPTHDRTLESAAAMLCLRVGRGGGGAERGRGRRGQGDSLRTPLFPLFALCIVAVQLALEVKLDLFPLLASLRSGPQLAYWGRSRCLVLACCTSNATLAGARSGMQHAPAKVEPDREGSAALHHEPAAQSTGRGPSMRSYFTGRTPTHVPRAWAP